MWLLVVSVIAVYLIGFVGTFLFNAGLGMITPGLCLLRAFAWPAWWLTGWPSGQPLPMD